MNIPSLPTDNLYKFMAIAGILLTAMCAIFIVTRIDELEIRVVKLEGEINTLELEKEFFLKEQERIEKKPKHAEMERLELIHKAHKLAVKLNEFETKTDEINVVLSQMKRYRIYLFLGMFFGLNLMFWGFRLWYTHVQKLQDAILRKRVTLKHKNKP